MFFKKSRLATEIKKFKSVGLTLMKDANFLPYKIPKGYLNWEDINGLIGVSDAILKSKENNPITRQNYSLILNWFNVDAPIYCVNELILDAFDLSDVDHNPKIMEDFKLPLPTFLLLFPKNKIINPVSKSALNFCVVQALNLRNDEPDSHIKIQVCGTDSELVSVTHGFFISPTGEIKLSTKILNSSLEEFEFANKLRSIVIQSMLTLNYVPELVEDITPEDIVINQKNGFGNTVTIAPECRYPRWLGKNYSENQSKSISPPTETLSNPQNYRKHWRRGHWRRVRVGIRELGDYKWTWIRPILVNALK